MVFFSSKVSVYKNESEVRFLRFGFLCSYSFCLFCLLCYIAYNINLICFSIIQIRSHISKNWIWCKATWPFQDKKIKLLNTTELPDMISWKTKAITILELSINMIWQCWFYLRSIYKLTTVYKTLYYSWYHITIFSSYFYFVIQSIILNNDNVNLLLTFNYVLRI
jgi:hypothetical protein